MLSQNISVLQQMSVSVLCAAFCVLSGCDSDSHTNPVSGELQHDQLAVGVPTVIRTIKAIDTAAINGSATVNGTVYPLDRDPSDNRFKRAITVPNNSDVTIELLFTETLSSGIVLELARHQQTVPIGNTNQTVTFLDRDYETEGFDRDNDQISNLAERSCGTDPTQFTQTFDNINVSFTIPSRISDPAITQVIATFGGVPRPAQRRGSSNTFDVSGNPQLDDETDIEIILVQQFNNQSVRIATAKLTTCSDVQSIQILDTDFDFDFDDDGDSISNLQELESGRNPNIRG